MASLALWGEKTIRLVCTQLYFGKVGSQLVGGLVNSVVFLNCLWHGYKKLFPCGLDRACRIQVLLFTNCQHYPVRSIIPGKDFSAGKWDYPVHSLCHLVNTEKTILFSRAHLCKTYTYVFIPPSAVFAIVNVYSYPFSHDLIRYWY